MMDIRDVKPFEIVFAIQCPMSIDLVLPSVCQHDGRKCVILYPRQPVAQVRVKIRDRINRRKQKAASLAKWQFLEIISFGGKILDTIKLRHRQELAVEQKAPPVISTADKVGLARLLDQDLAAMCTHI